MDFDWATATHLFFPISTILLKHIIFGFYKDIKANIFTFVPSHAILQTQVLLPCYLTFPKLNNPLDFWKNVLWNYLDGECLVMFGIKLAQHIKRRTLYLVRRSGGIVWICFMSSGPEQ